MSSPKSSFRPYVSNSTKLPEFTFRAILLGGLLGLLFGVGNAYLGLKVGTTVSASIPAAVMSMAILRIFSKNVSILENNLVQTIASVGEGLAAGIIFTIPALFLLDEPPSVSRIVLLSLTGGILGILFMIPMRRYIIVEEHHKIPFPEGTACFEILKTGQSAKAKAFTAVFGLFLGSLFKVLSSGLGFFKETVYWKLNGPLKSAVSLDCTPALLGVGYIIGPKIASYLLFGGVLGWGVLIPLISMIGQGQFIIYPATFPISSMTPDDIWSNYIRYIGCGTVAVGGLVSLLKIIPLIKKTLIIGFKELFHKSADLKARGRTDRDISLKWLILGSIVIILFLWLNPDLPLNFLTVVLLSILGFFFVAVTSITVGVVGSTSNPVSGMTIVTLLLTCLIFLGLGWTDRIYLIAAITMSVVVNIAIALAATTSQDLKTGFLVGATPKWQQIGEMIGIILPALAIAFTVYLLDQAYGFGSQNLPAPQGTLIALLAKGVISGNIPINLVLIGAVIGLLLALLRIPILPVAIGLYLPLSLSTATMLGSIIPLILEKMKASKDQKERGILAASGMIAGDACTGVILALLVVLGKATLKDSYFFSDVNSLIAFGVLALAIWYVCVKPPKILRE